jgi:outer membrane protein assembly factor BamE (lipoprotein component of BamABCDE complex)
MRPRPNVCSRARHRLAAFAGVAALGFALSGCIGYNGDFDRGYQVDQQTLDQIKVGDTTKPQALALMGTPSTTSTVGGDAWYYIGQKMSRQLAFLPAKMTDQNVLAIYFDKKGKVDRIANYGMKDGKVFDFVSRTTPTGGQEPNFLRNIMTGLFKFT